MRKKKILLVCEGSNLSSGYGTYAKNLLTHLHNSGKYIVGEIGGFTRTNDPRIADIPWEFFPNVPVAPPELVEQFNSRESNKNGDFVLDGVCLKFRPDITLTIRDYWNEDYVTFSPARRIYKYIHAAQVDSSPQRPCWLKAFSNIDRIVTYTDWGAEVLRKEAQGNINLVGSVGSGVDTNFFKPMDKNACRQSLGIPLDAFVIGTVNRNQSRKQFGELAKAFAMFLEKAPAPIAAKSYLYIHSKWPDMPAPHSWSFPDLLKEFSIGSRTFFSQVCHKCRACSASLFRGSPAFCKVCGEFALHMPGIEDGVSSNVLGYIYNSLDAYVQYSSNEGFGMSQPEAAACGVPVFSVDWSAMIDVCRKVNGFPIKIKGYYRELNTDADRAYPDNDHFVKLLIQYARLPQELRLKYKNLSVQGVLQNYTWEIVSEKWMRVIDELDYADWDQPASIHPIPNSVPDGLNNDKFVQWCFSAVGGRPDLVKTRYYTEMLSDLNQGFYSSNKQPCNRETIYQLLIGWGEMKNNFERQRCGV